MRALSLQRLGAAIKSFLRYVRKRPVKRRYASLGRDFRFALSMAFLRGGLSTREAWYLRQLSAENRHGYRLEVGSFRGKSAVALYEGMLDAGCLASPLVYCVEPHREFVGVYGGRFGPQDRGAFYRAMLLTGAYRGVALVNLTSEDIAGGWQRPLSLVFIDGDHSYSAVAKDVGSWAPHLIPGGVLVFDDALDPQIGPYQVIAELLSSGAYARVGGVGKIVALRKLSPPVAPPVQADERKKNILIITRELFLSGGMLRFERTGRVLIEQGHHVVFCAEEPDRLSSFWEGQLPVIGLEEAWRCSWDVTMLPGRAGLDGETDARWLQAFTDPRFGLRIQHILNDRQYETAFLRLNRIFSPHLVIFNNPTWCPGEFTLFSANEFHVLQGGVDWSRFAECERTPAGNVFVVGGQATKNPWPLLETLDALPLYFELRLFGADHHGLARIYARHIASGRLRLVGPLGESGLPDYYSGLDAVVSPEEHAGWANLVAEAMAAGVPVVCTSAGTSALAVHQETALVIEQLTPEAIAAALKQLFAAPDLRQAMSTRARARVRQFGWDIYAMELLALMSRGRDCHYYHAPWLGMYGKWPVADRFKGLEPVMSELACKSVLDIGSAEGIIARACLYAGASVVHGIEIDAARVAKARELCQDKARFFVADLDAGVPNPEEAELLPVYDYVLYLGVHHHLQPRTRKQMFQWLVGRCAQVFVLRTSDEVFRLDDLGTVLQEHGFSLRAECIEDAQLSMGALWIYSR